MARSRKLPRIFDYEDYRPFLRDHYLARKALDPAFSYGAFAKRVGIASRSHLKLVMDGKKALTPAFVDRYAKGLHLQEDEARHLRLLMERVHAPDERAREAVTAALRTSSFERGGAVPPGIAKAIVLDWPKRIVFALTRLEDFQADPRWISRRLGGGIRPAEARRALDFLGKHGLVLWKGRKLLRSVSGRVPLNCSLPFQAALKSADRVHREIRSSLARAPESSKVILALPAMTAAEAGEFARRVGEAILAIPGRGQTRSGTEVFAVQVEVTPLSRPDSVSSRVNSPPEGKRACRRSSRG